jgi:Fe-S oxidoreductase
MGIFQEPRQIIKSLGYQLKEMKFCGKYSFCCGAGGGIKTKNPSLADRIAQERLRQARETKAKILCTTCPMCYLHLKNQNSKLGVQSSKSKETEAKNIEVKELSELILERLKQK